MKRKLLSLTAPDATAPARKSVRENPRDCRKPGNSRRVRANPDDAAPAARGWMA